MTADLQKRIEERIDAVIIDSVPKDLTAEFSLAMDEGTMDAFLARNVPDIDRRIAQALETFKREVVGA